MKRTVLLSVSALLVTLLLSVTVNAGLISVAGAGTAPVSPALNIIADYTPVAKAGMVGNEVLFTPEDFERALNISHLSSLTVVSLPSVTEGSLYMGSVAVAAGQTISRANLSLLSYAAANDSIKRGSFEFSVNGQPYTLTCSVYLLDKINYSPTTTSPGASLSVSTYRDIAAYGKLYGYDPEGDELTYQIVSYPKNGVLLLYDEDGRYVYMPNKGYTGTDSLRYVVHDKYGNYSAASTVKLKVNKNATATAYDDMKWNDAYSSAIKLTEAGIMSGTRIGGANYFYPTQSLSRAEFLVMAMRAADISSLPTVTDTGFDDDADIPTSMKPYVGAAVRAGYISGYDIDGKKCFKPNEEITIAEAAQMCAKILDLKYDGSISASAGNSSVPTWARESVLALSSAGLLDIGATDYTKSLTRADAAKLLAGMMDK